MGALVKYKEKREIPLEGLAWLNFLPKNQRHFVKDCIDSVIGFSKGSYKPFFQNCGLYAVGSSITSPHHNDVDLVLVGLDFRAIIEYNKAFLMDPEYLIEKGILTEPHAFEVLKEENGEPTLLRPISQTDHWEARGRKGVMYKGRIYDYNVDRFLLGGLDLNSCLANESDASDLVYNLRKHLAKDMGMAVSDLHGPFEQYFHCEEWFLTTPFVLYPVKGTGGPIELTDSIFPDDEDLNLPFPPIHFIFHTENLHVSSWKEHQKRYNLPYMTLYEWPMAGQNVENRPVLTHLELPDFIDPEGIERVKWNPFFSYLKEPPIEAGFDAATQTKTLPACFPLK
ncbi:hypothetical protein COV19_06670 [Candidatus Woesearchaeota archaeon CG10_big_fil_rev_8_21_14_0_10_44_13]|nr:MAG: hypothetical protein COV19_06670 [Candidatus Woesearchaeota archaeon CG10_big_fil_rev_8_21_14_0_10_44_13]